MHCGDTGSARLNRSRPGTSVQRRAAPNDAGPMTRRPKKGADSVYELPSTA